LLVLYALFVCLFASEFVCFKLKKQSAQGKHLRILRKDISLKRASFGLSPGNLGTCFNSSSYVFLEEIISQKKTQKNKYQEYVNGAVL